LGFAHNKRCCWPVFGVCVWGVLLLTCVWGLHTKALLCGVNTYLWKTHQVVRYGIWASSAVFKRAKRANLLTREYLCILNGGYNNRVVKYMFIRRKNSQIGPTLKISAKSF
jgi:hypothetical protein